jgi:hypothetical protein
VRASLRFELIKEREDAAVADILKQVRAETTIWVDQATISSMQIDPANFQKRARGPMN